MSKKVKDNNIQESYCSHEVSVLLKKRGFNCVVSRIFNKKGEDEFLFNEDNWRESRKVHRKNSYIVARPTHALAIEWIRKNYGLWISIGIGSMIHKGKYYLLIFRESPNTYYPVDNKLHSPYDSPQEATEAALNYLLKKIRK